MAQILLRHNNADTLLLHGHDRLHHLLDDFRRQAFRRFVQQYQRWITHQGTGDRQHLLFTAAHAPAETALHLAEIRKQRE